ENKQSLFHNILTIKSVGMQCGRINHYLFYCGKEVRVMRFKLFNIREDEKPYAYQWGQNNGHEIECTEEDLTLDNVHTLSSF
ncbi:hypothetical protein Q5762_39320, partial [Streptomyces sp. P9(2023)]|uniref:hypothetical protein n=1 Tax=Streptomyces sp. P9(2023) TaxID=3064394 RepID=UPI0028F43497